MSSPQTDHEYYMRLAMAEAAMCAAAGGRPYGSIVVHNGIVVGRSGARKDSYKNPTGHDEILAIQEAASYLGTADMTDCTMYTNRGSCPMCSATMVSNNLSLVVRGIRPAEGDREFLDPIIALLGRCETRISLKYFQVKIKMNLWIAFLFSNSFKNFRLFKNRHDNSCSIMVIG